MMKSVALALVVAGVSLQPALAAQKGKAPASPMSPSQPFVRDPRIPVDEEYTKKIKEYTTEPFFTSPLVDYLPSSKTVPTPKAVLGDVAGGARHPSIRGRGLPLHADARESKPAREGGLDRHH